MKLKRLFVITLILSVFQVGDMTFAKRNIGNKISHQNKRVTDDTNLHYTGRYCNECHARIPRKGENIFLKFGGDFSRLCKCHNYTPWNYTHPVGIKPSNEKKAKIPGEFPLNNGKLECNTCHDIYLQCRYSKFRPPNKKFLRGGPYSKRTVICFKCHDEDKYKKLDPHDQLNADGEIIAEKCLYCHTEKPNERNATFENIELVGDIKMICRRCHNILDKHPAGENHFRIPNIKMLKMIKSVETSYNVTLPLDYKGRVTCITCHNPHERGVIPNERKGAKGADKKHRQRLAGIMCNACHEL
jgi:hypothetical protein